MWCRQGFSLWCASVRRTVSEEMESTMPHSMSSRASSAQSQVERLRPILSGRSQAILTRWTATSGGKNRLAPTARLILQPPEALLEKALDPLVHNHARNTHTPC